MQISKTDTWNPQLYHTFQKERSAPFFDLMALIKKEGTHFKHVVDLGCGTGELTKILQVNLDAQEVIGVDSSQAMLEKARVHEDDNLKFRHQSIEEALKSAQPDSLDLIFSNASLQWCDHHADLLPKMFKDLKNGGQVAIQLPANHDYPTHEIALKLAGEGDYAAKNAGRPYTVLPAEEYSRLLYIAGFKEQNVILQVYPHILKSRDDVLEWVKGTLLTHYERALGPELYSKFLNDYKDALFKVLPDNKPFFYPFKRLHVWARK